MQSLQLLRGCIFYRLLITAFILSFTCYASNAQATSHKGDLFVTMKGTNIPLRQVFNTIREQTGYAVMYSVSLTQLSSSEKVTVNFNKAPLADVMTHLLRGKNLTWYLEKETILIIRKEDAAKKNIAQTNNGQDTSSTVFAVTGKVTEVDGAPIPGATVLVKGTEQGATTDADGNFSLPNVNQKSVLLIRSVGYETREIPVKRRTILVQLNVVVSELDETVVIAYGTTTRRYSTGNISTVKAKEIERQPVNNPLLALQGRVPGLQITPTTGLAGGTVNIQIRGKNSLNYASEPLIVVDGLPVINNITGLGHDQLSQFSALSFINPHDIESIEVLKDADATSIYGSRGANGVILITTKKGQPGQTKVDINVQTGWADVPKKMKLLNTEEYLKLRKEGYDNAGIDFINTFPYGDPAYTDLVAPDLFAWDKNRNIDWQKELIGGTARYNDMQASVSGGTSLVRYQIRGNYHKETTVFPGNNADTKGSAHLSLTGESPNQKLNTTVTVSYMADRNTLPGIDFTNEALTLSPNAPSPYNADGSLNWEPLSSGISSWNNPYAQLSKTYDAKVKNLVASGLVSYRVFPHITLKAQVGYNELRGNSFRKVDPFAGKKPEDMASEAGSAFNTSYIKNLSVEPQINYNGHISKGELDALIGASYQSTDAESEFLVAYGFTNDALLSNLAAATTLWASNTSSQYRYSAFFGRLSYNWDNKYLLSLSARRDGSSRFGPGNQFGNFGSVGVAWIFTQEKFMKVADNIISYGKLRFSYGTSGNDGIGDYQYLERYEPIIGLDPYQGARGYRSTGLFNAYYAWEVTKKMEFGLETGFFKERILLNASYFRNRSNNQLLGYPAPTMAGPGVLLYNLPAVIQNMGVELTLTTENIKTNSLLWSTSINFTSNRNKLVSFPDLGNSAYYTSEVGQPFTGIARVYNSAGVDPNTGQYQFTDTQGKNTLSPEDPTRVDGGRYIRIMTSPKFYGGVSNTFSYKGISLDVHFQFTKQNGLNPLSPYLLIAGVSARNLPAEYLFRWQTPGDVSDIQKIYGVVNDDLINASNRLMESNWNYVDASFIRLKNVSLSYSIPKSFKQKLHLNNIRIYLQGQNLWTITNYKGLDPETQSIGTLPPLRVITVGANVTF
ncbi:SusC/RagA family TonB-linked outer membrane protein [uncultured Chitinophaga sp.]|jgi:TonB-linked outer membrane protein, SusC/RagA family|uniref:SusC/RagA family TonB-linked outer membrane protein n=1 Tax=uncultured Chitinophaga sp. TaxID=339340 RepID=UPI002609F8EE|nr:SusC/RagA family TonB-linked outer membrane protein [uncultured Chitinophaga sp.]